MTLIKLPLLILEITALIGMGIMFAYFKTLKRTPFIMEPLMWVFNLGGFIYALYGFYIQEHFVFKSGLTLIAISYGIWFSFLLDRIEDLKQEKKSKNER